MSQKGNTFAHIAVSSCRSRQRCVRTLGSNDTAEPRQADRDVGRCASRMHFEFLDLADPAALVGQQIDQRLAERDDHSSNRAISGTWSDLPKNGLSRSPNLRVSSRSIQRSEPPEK